MDRIENIEFCIRYLLEIEKTKLGIETGIPHDLRGKQRLLRALMNIWEPQPLSEEYLRAQDAELQAQIQDKGVVTLEDITASVPRSVLLWQGDITRLRVDAIVNAANSQMMGCWYPLHTCIDNCIHSAAGLQLRAECAEAMSSAECPSVHPEYTRNNTTYRQAFTSETLITEAYNLPCQYVIHTVGPIILDGVPTKEQEEQLYSCYRNCLETAKE
jgi:O-acetyl-ADP-ribose deacetylase (regulator of RNase III)